MSLARKILKVVGILVILSAVLEIAVGALLIGGSSLLAGQTVSDGGQAVDATTAALGLGIFVIAVACVEVAMGALAVRGANNPAKMGAFKVLATIGVLLTFAQLGMFAVTGQLQSWSLGSTVSLIVDVVCVILAFKVSSEAKEA